MFPCARKALEELPRLPRSPSMANAVTLAIGCAAAMPPDSPQRKELLGSRLLGVEGYMQNESGVVHLVARRLVDHSPLLGRLMTDSRDFH